MVFCRLGESPAMLVPKPPFPKPGSTIAKITNLKIVSVDMVTLNIEHCGK